MLLKNYALKAKLSLWLSIISVNFIFASVPESSVTANQTINYAKTATIDALDSVVFDLAKAVKNGNVVSFPISILSDDTINALDFSFKYNHTTFTYDSITDLTTYLQPLAFYNPNDSTVRFTSNSFQRYEIDTPLVMVHFTLLASQFDSTDFNTIKVYLNGNGCSIKLTNTISTDVNKIQSAQNNLFFFPNPANSKLQIVVAKAPSQSTIEISNTSGKILFFSEVNTTNSANLILQDLTWPAGIYVVKLKSEKVIETKKLIIYK